MARIDVIKERFGLLMTRLGQPLAENQSSGWNLDFISNRKNASSCIRMIRYTEHGGHTFPLGHEFRSERDMLKYLDEAIAVLDLASGTVSGASLFTKDAFHAMLAKAKQHAIEVSSVALNPTMAIVWREVAGDSIHERQGWSIYGIDNWSKPDNMRPTIEPFATVGANGSWFAGPAFRPFPNA